VILVGTTFWRGLLDWFRSELVPGGMIAATDMNLVQVIDEPANVVDAIFAFYEAHGIAPAETERQMGSFL
jgi:predicted Rossmann-fold nucleotide-binding protein